MASVMRSLTVGTVINSQEGLINVIRLVTDERRCLANYLIHPMRVVADNGGGGTRRK